jgi:hypothetical protein
LEREQGIPAPAIIIDGNAAGREGMAILLMAVVKAWADVTKPDPHEQEEIEQDRREYMQRQFSH